MNGITYINLIFAAIECSGIFKSAKWCQYNNFTEILYITLIYFLQAPADCDTSNVEKLLELLLSKYVTNPSPYVKQVKYIFLSLQPSLALQTV